LGFFNIKYGRYSFYKFKLYNFQFRKTNLNGYVFRSKSIEISRTIFGNSNCNYNF